MSMKKAKKCMVRCEDCAHSSLVRWWNNPVIAVCGLLKNCGKPVRNVAHSTHKCTEFCTANREKRIEQRYSYDD